jgi:metal-responsive CopG/Arc/MetJ family transcriptional regulator
MSSAETMRKVTILLPQELLDYADRRAKALNTSRSQVIAQALAAVHDRTVEQVAAEGYHFYAAEASEFAEASAPAVAEGWSEVWLASSTDDEAANGAAR